MFEGLVVHGDKKGRELGYPTANLDIPAKDTKCNTGVYACFAFIGKRKYPAALIVNSRPNKVEVYLFDYDGGECYGASIQVDPVQKVSEIERYESLEELKKKIASDIEIVKRVLKI